jgi:hypothetical protein
MMGDVMGGEAVMFHRDLRIGNAREVSRGYLEPLGGRGSALL